MLVRVELQVHFLDYFVFEELINLAVRNLDVLELIFVLNQLRLARLPLPY